jgi:hypothetical protein
MTPLSRKKNLGLLFLVEKLGHPPYHDYHPDKSFWRIPMTDTPEKEIELEKVDGGYAYQDQEYKESPKTGREEQKKEQTAHQQASIEQMKSKLGSLDMSNMDIQGAMDMTKEFTGMVGGFKEEIENLQKMIDGLQPLIDKYNSSNG